MHQALYLIVSRLEPDTMYLSVSIQRHPPLYLASKKINYKTRGKGPTDGGHTGTEKRSTRGALRRTHQDQRHLGLKWIRSMCVYPARSKGGIMDSVQGIYTLRRSHPIPSEHAQKWLVSSTQLVRP